MFTLGLGVCGCGQGIWGWFYHLLVYFSFSFLADKRINKTNMVFSQPKQSALVIRLYISVSFICVMVYIVVLNVIGGGVVWVI